MNKFPLSFSMKKQAALAGLLLMAFAIPALAQPLTFNTLAGIPGGGSVDGARADARFNSPIGIATDSSGNIYVADTANHIIRKVTPTGVVTTIAGLPGVSGSTNGTGPGALFNAPAGVAVDTNGNVYVSDTGNHLIRQITPGGVVNTWAGQAGVSGNNEGVGTNAQFNLPQGIAVDNGGNLYVADYGNHSIRKITPGKSVRTLAGFSGSSGNADGSSGTARFYQPQGVAVDAAGFVYVADTANGTIRKITSAGTVSTLAGTALTYGSSDGSGTNVSFYQPEAVAVDSSGNVYVADYINHSIRKVTAGGVVSTIAGTSGVFGSADGTNGTARFWGPEGIAISSGGAVYVADTGNNTIRRLSFENSATVVITLAGSASSGNTDATGNNARFYWPGGLAVGGTGVVYIADTENNSVRKLTPAGLASTIAGLPGSSGTNDGSGPSARFYGPQGVAADSSGNLVVADSANGTIRAVTSSGAVSTLAGIAGLPGSLDGTNGTAQFYEPQAVVMDGSGNAYVADTWNHTIRKVTSGGVVTTIAGLAGNFGSADGYNSDARFNWPSGIARDTSGNLFVSDNLNHTIRKLTYAEPDWIVSTVAGLPGVWGFADGTNGAARFYHPQGISVDAAGNIYVVDSGSQVIRKITISGTNAVVSTVAGLPGFNGAANGTGAASRFSAPAGIAIAPNGTFYVTEAANNEIRQAVLITNGGPAIVAQPQSLKVNPGSNATFTVTAIGSGTLNYQWRFNGTNIPGMTASTYTKLNAQIADIGNYSVLITNTSGSVLSADASLFLTVPPFIIVQPVGQIAGLGQSATFSVIAGGDAPISYQWLFFGSPISGGTNSSFTIPSVQGSNNGIYSVLVNNLVGSIASSNAPLAVIAMSSIGDNSFGQTNVPLSSTNTIAIAAGTWHNLALHADGKVVAWGSDFQGQCHVPVSLNDALAIAAGGYHSLAIRSNGKVIAWGANDYGQTNVPTGLTNALAIACGTWHSLALRPDGTLVAWGDNSRGQIDIPHGLNHVVAIAAGGNHSLALKDDGTVVAWGENTGSGGGFAGQSIVPANLGSARAIAAGEFHSLVVLTNGTVVAWGDDNQAQSEVPPGLSNVVAVAGGSAHSLALKADGSVAAWGGDASGQMDFPPFLSDAIAVSAGGAHSLILVRTILPNPLLLNAALGANGFTSFIQTLNRKNYALEFNSLLIGGTWTPVTTNVGNGALEILSDPAPQSAPGFYRMRQW